MANPTTNLGITLPLDENTAQKVTTYNTAFNEMDAADNGYVVKSVAGAAGTTTLTRDEALHKAFKFNGAITGARSVSFPSTGGCPREIRVWNATTGVFTLTVKLGSSTGVAVTQNKKVILVQDGSDWIAWTPEV